MRLGYFSNLEDKIKDLYDKILKRDEFKSNYLSDFESLRAQYWISKIVPEANTLTLMQVLFCLAGKDSMIYVDDFSTTHFSFMNKVYHWSFNEDASKPVITIKYFNPASDMNKLANDLSLLTDVSTFNVVSENSLFFKPVKSNIDFNILLVNREEYLEAREIINVPACGMLALLKNEESFMSKRRELIADFVSAHLDKLNEGNVCAIVESDTSLTSIVCSKDFTDKLKELISDDELDNISEKSRKKVIIARMQSFAENPYEYTLNGKKQIITLYRYIKTE
ncbi:MAG: hypothetical protein JW791_03160 [Nanoarchaeota archaeon]|nr:hypothetical protein [Nanoarchaeota archaeon]